MRKDFFGRDDEVVTVGTCLSACRLNWWDGFWSGTLAGAVAALAAVLLSVWAAQSARAQEPVPLAPHHRVANRPDYGVCWWACAQMVGNAKGIVPLQNVVDRVVESGIGFKGGADSESIDHWVSTLKLRALSNPPGAKDQRAVDRVQGWLDRGLPVIVSYAQDGGTSTHAVLLVKIGRAKEAWTSDAGDRVEDYPVEYVDPNDPHRNVRHSWTWFASAWTGRAVTFDPADQDRSLVRPPELRPGRLMIADGKWHRAGALAAGHGHGPGHDQGHGDHQTPGAPPVPAIPTRQHDEPFLARNPVNRVPYVHVPSNQDMGDGVTRPSDVFYNYAGYGPGYDYYARYRSGTRTRP